jgi:hypothetical protein
MKNGQFVQDIKIVNCCNGITAFEDVFDGNPASDVINMKGWGRCTFIIFTGAGATGAATMTVESCDDVTPSTTTAIAYKYWDGASVDVLQDMQVATTSGVITPDAGAGTFSAIEIDASALSGTDNYVRLQMTESTNSPVDGACIAILSNPRYSHESTATAVV